jgi:hypothetical protein
VTQGEGPEFKPQYHTHTHKSKNKKNKEWNKPGASAVILVNQEAEIKRITIGNQHGQIV